MPDADPVIGRKTGVVEGAVIVVVDVVGFFRQESDVCTDHVKSDALGRNVTLSETR